MTAVPRVDIDGLTARLGADLAAADVALTAAYPGTRPGRQPVHTVYVPADRFHEELESSWSDQARLTVRDFRRIFERLVPAELRGLVDAKLTSEPIEDLRVDFEDGYGRRDDADEDAAAVKAATVLAAARPLAAPFTGIRFKSLEAPTRARGLRTLAIVIDTLLASGGSLDGFVVTLPKVTSVEQVTAMVTACELIERDLGLPPVLRFEIQVETPQSILGPDGAALVARMIHAANGFGVARCTGLHYGTYDYSAFCGISAEHQSLEHPVADHAKAIMQAAAAGTGVRLSDGSTNVLPIGDDSAVEAGWSLHLRLIRRSLARGYYQGWDLHPAQLPIRFAATFGFFTGGLPRVVERLRNYLSGAAGGVLDEPATARALADFLYRGIDCGAVDALTVAAECGVTPAQLGQLARPGR